MKVRSLFFIISFLSMLAMPVAAQTTIEEDLKSPFFGASCTSIMVGKQASVDGSVMTSHTCDGRYRTWMRWEKAQDYTSKNKCVIYKGNLKTRTPYDKQGVVKAGEIPQASHTYAFLNTAYPCLNEKQLAIGETTIVGPKELVNKKGWFQIEELARIALERCSSARQAIRLIDYLIAEYGYGDWGECITIADKNEVWQMEIFGEGKDKIGGVWAAQRVPDAHIAISANRARIGELDLDNADFYMASKNIFKVAKRLKRWDGSSIFKFWKVYGGNEKPFGIRDFFVLNHFAPSLHLSMEQQELPFSVVPEHKVSVQEVMALYRECYENTPWDMTQRLKIIKKKKDKKGIIIQNDTIVSPIAHPWPTRGMRELCNALRENSIAYQRTVAVAWCSYSFVVQLRSDLPDEIGGRLFLSFDNPAQSPRIPIYSGMSELPTVFHRCGQKGYVEEAILWKYRKANKLATLRWQETRKELEEERDYFEYKMLKDCDLLEKEWRRSEVKEQNKKEWEFKLNRFTRDFVGATVFRWQELEHEYWERFGLGF
jgi:dipeptidase